MDSDSNIELQKHFGKQVKKYRKAVDMTQKELAVKAGTDERHIQRIEAGDNATSITLAYTIAKVLSVRLDSLFE